MADEPAHVPADGALRPFPPGPLIRIAHGATTATIAPQAGGRIAQVVHDGLPWLVDHGPGNEAMIAWGSYPMLPWAGRLRNGRVTFDGRRYALPPNLGAHAIHGLGFALPWQVDAHAPGHVELSLRLPRDERWPFGGIARQRIALDGEGLHCALVLTAEEQAMPAVVGWHPWFRKPERVAFSPEAMYPRDHDGIAIHPPGPPSQGPWDDCFLADAPAVLHRAGHRLQLESDCRHWVIYDVPEHATCVEPQTGPPDGFNLEPKRIEAGKSLGAWFRWRWL
jgi:aldose 1-epimerase